VTWRTISVRLCQQEGFSVDAFFLIDSATKSVKPTLRMQYEADGLKMELYFATALKGTEISCHERTVITVGRCKWQPVETHVASA